MVLRETTEFDGTTYEVTWHGGVDLPPQAHVTQASGICYSRDGRIVMVSADGTCWGIPGGHPETGEPVESALRREIREEACCDVTEARLLGWQHVSDTRDDSVHYQLRYCCRVEVSAFRPEHEVSHRQLVAPSEFLSELHYGSSPIAAEIFALAQKTIAGMP